jgi:hypothetical protein
MKTEYTVMTPVYILPIDPAALASSISFQLQAPYIRIARSAHNEGNFQEGTRCRVFRLESCIRCG